RMQPQRDARDEAEPAARAREQLAEVVAGDVLHHLAAGARDRPVGEDDRDADDEVAHRTVAVAARAGEVAGEAGADGRVPWRVEREHLVVRGELRLEPRQAYARLDDRRQIARLVLEHAVEAAGREQDVAAVALDRDAAALGEHRCGLLERRGLRDARQPRLAPADARGRGPAPRRRGAASETPCP